MGRQVFSIAVVLVSALTGAASEGVWVDREALLMGTRLRAEVEAPAEAEAQRVIDRLFEAVTALELNWTTGQSGSELAGLRSAELGMPVSLSEGTFDLLAQAWSLAERTDGAFEPTVGPLIDAWKSEEDGVSPGAVALDRARASVGRRCFDLSPAARTISRYCPDAWIDGGGFGKGAALAAIEEILDEERIERARIDFGGHLLVRGSDPAIPRTAEIADPRDRDRAAYEFLQEDGSTATSSQSGRGSEIDGVFDSRVVDPRSGVPVEAWGSVTVRSEDPVEADAMATALFVMGPRDGIRWLAARPDVEAVLLVVSGDSVTACGTERLLEILTPVASGAVRSSAPLISETLRSCP